MHASAVSINARSTPSALDPELPRLAASAALEADLAICDPSSGSEFPALRRLFERLPEKLPDFNNSQTSLNLLDPLSEDLFRRALSQSLSVKATSESFEQLRRATEALVDKAHGAQSQQLTEIRDFCLALSNYAAANRNVRHSPSHRSSPYRI